jgi:DNA-binding response OmpR family regulator
VNHTSKITTTLSSKYLKKQGDLSSQNDSPKIAASQPTVYCVQIGHVAMVFLKNKSIWILESDHDATALYEKVLGIRYKLRFFTSKDHFTSDLSNGNDLPDLAIADLNLISGSFLALLKWDNKSYHFPWITVSAIDDLDAIRFCFHEGASDYLAKPLKINELIVKIERILTQGSSYFSSLKFPTIHGLILDSSTLRLKTQNGVSTQFTTKEHQIFSLLYSNTNKKVSRQEIVEFVWNDVKVSSKNLDVQLFNLRKKLDLFGLKIQFFAPHYFQLCEKGDEN